MREIQIFIESYESDPILPRIHYPITHKRTVGPTCQMLACYFPFKCLGQVDAFVGTNSGWQQTNSDIGLKRINWKTYQQDIGNWNFVEEAVIKFPLICMPVWEMKTIIKTSGSSRKTIQTRRPRLSVEGKRFMVFPR